VTQRRIAYVHEGAPGSVPPTARHLAEQGFDVTLVVSVRRAVEIESVDGISVVTCTESVLFQRGLAITRTPRWPDLRAYGTQIYGRLRADRNQVRLEELAFLADVNTSRGRPTIPSLVLTLRTRVAHLERRWIAMRTRATQRAQHRLLDHQRLSARISRRVWLAVEGNRAWQRFDSGLWDREATFATVLDDLAPDLIHAEGLPVAAVAIRARHRSPRHPIVVWDDRASRKIKEPLKARARELLEADLGVLADHRLTQTESNVAEMYRHFLNEEAR